MRFPSCLPFVVVATFALGLGAGCVYRTPEAHVPQAMSPIGPAEIEVDCVSVDDPEGPLDPKTDAEIRGEATAILKAAGPRRTHDAPAHVRAHVTLGDSRGIEDAMHEDGFAAMVYLYAPFGLAIDRQEVSVEVTVETPGHTFTGHGKAERLGSIYARARRRALAVALDRALADAATHGM